ncbi:MAG: NADH-quinone oxidoreductase subunit NuoH [Bacteriovoracaceae bacterium]|nr:NADH-quinone oxidoreductase subunit NuoH [Bacteriovoracaceae bacterium]
MQDVFIVILKSLVALFVPLLTLPLILQVERRGAAYIQKRVGPNRVGPFGILQPLADVLKFLFKEEVTPSHVQPFFYNAAPIISLIVAVLPLAAIPFCAPFELNGAIFFPEAFHSPLGVFYIFAVAELGFYGILLAGWASNNKFSMLGALRATAQMVSYELSLSVTIVCILLVYGTVDIHEIIAYQEQSLLFFIPRYGFLLQPIAMLIFLVGIFAECNRLPFDLAEGESELVAGYHVEYSSMKFAMFFLSEYMHMIVLSALFVILFFGGYSLLPGLSLITASSPALLPYLQFLSLIAKVAFMIWFFIWVRWSIPRFRYDQLMHLGWKILFPLSILNLLITVIVTYLWGNA